MTEEIQNYIHKSQRYLQDCQLLQTQGGSADSVVSRAYYAMFYVAKARLLSISAKLRPNSREKIAVLTKCKPKAAITP